MTDRLYALAENVHDEESFIAFVRALAEDWDDEQRKEGTSPSPRFGPGANGWESGTVGNFLEAAAAWAIASIDGTVTYKKPENPWKRAAQILYAGKAYE